MSPQGYDPHVAVGGETVVGAAHPERPDATTDATTAGASAGSVPSRTSGLAGRLAETLAVLGAPVVAFFVLHIREMAPIILPDPSIHTSYIIQPRDLYLRYGQVFASTDRLREEARVGLLIPARLAYLAFGAVPGFLVLRYLFALVVIGPAFLLLKRLYGRAAGAVGVIAVMSCPVILTAWGTDYPDSAVVSYCAGALACLAMPTSARWRRAVIAGAGALFTMAIWSNGIGVPLAAASFLAYGAVRMVRDRNGIVGDAALLVAVGLGVTGVLSIGSEVVFGRFDFIAPTWHAYQFLNRRSQYGQWHSTSWLWAPYLSYLLVPPAVLVGFVVVFSDRWRASPRSGVTAGESSAIPTSQLVVGSALALQLAVFVYLQFLNHVQSLEQHYFSSTLWGAVVLAFSVTVAELARKLFARRVLRWLPAAVLVAVPLVAEHLPNVPAFSWWPFGFIAAGALIVAAAGAATLGGRDSGSLGAAASVGGIALVTAAVLVLTVAPSPPHARIAHASINNLPPSYASALGTSGSVLVDRYRVASELPGFVGQPAYPGEQLIMWWSNLELQTLVEPIGLYHGAFNSLPSDPPVLTSADRQFLAQRAPAEMLLLSTTGKVFPAELRALAPYRPRVVRTTVLVSGPVAVHAWLLALGVFARAGQS